MVVTGAVFFAGVAGDTIAQYERILAMRYFQYLSFGAFFINVDVLALDEARLRLAA
jgi:hypothetical protein